jgi:hypothetical protein
MNHFHACGSAVTSEDRIDGFSAEFEELSAIRLSVTAVRRQKQLRI